MSGPEQLVDLLHNVSCGPLHTALMINGCFLQVDGDNGFHQ